jgi:DNA-binding FadR family transcriptional regulator
MAGRSTAMKASAPAETDFVEGADVADSDDDLFAPTRMLLFAPLGSTDMPSAVVHRLRAAIGLGLLPDGKRLPKEADLATQLGVTTFALREALAELRKQGLLVTKAGKYGGSFVTYPADSEQLEQDELVELSSAELRDVGDWRQMLAAHAAALAAQRASESNIKMLNAYAARVGEADSSLDARRAHGRFLLELAAAAQSMRMTRAEFAVHEQIDWLFGLALQTPDERTASSTGLAEIAAAVESRDPQRARVAAEGYVSRLLGRLARLRFERIAAGHQGGAAVSTTLAGEVRAIVDGLVTTLDGFAEDIGPVLASGGTFDAVRSRITLGALQRIEEFPAFVKGTGVITEVGVMPDHPYWIQWWQRTEAGPVADNHHVLDPSREDFYDYEMRDFVDIPRREHVPCAFGPYLDYGGVDDFDLTISVPIIVDAKFYGVTCVDVLVADLESWLSPLLAASGESYLINCERRVIVSNSATRGAGDLIAESADFEVHDFAPFCWKLLTRSAERQTQ